MINCFHWRKLKKNFKEYMMENKIRAAMAVVINEKEEILILKRTPDVSWMPNKWGLPGGHVEDGETPKQGAARETLEETSLKLLDLKKLQRRGQAMIYYSTSYNGEVEIDIEHTDWAWVSYDEMDNYDTTPNLKDTVKLALEKIK